ncbi:hypothetical protein J7643_13255 [bacterium]|nr:hypothetical protein [bacterium]
MTPTPSPDPAGPAGSAQEPERMEKEPITLEDGRTLIYYRFVPEAD